MVYKLARKPGISSSIGVPILVNLYTLAGAPFGDSTSGNTLNSDSNSTMESNWNTVNNEIENNN